MLPTVVENEYPALEERLARLELNKTIDTTERNQQIDLIRSDWCGYRDIWSPLGYFYFAHFNPVLIKTLLTSTPSENRQVFASQILCTGFLFKST